MKKSLIFCFAALTGLVLGNVSYSLQTDAKDAKPFTLEIPCEALSKKLQGIEPKKSFVRQLILKI